MAILDAGAASRAGWPLLDLAAAYLKGGARLLQLRAKDVPGASFLEAATAIVALAHREGARVIINDRADIARIAGADGVHVGQDDLSPSSVRGIVGNQAMIGLSTHTPEEVAAACQVRSGSATPLTYLAIGPVFATSTKPIRLDAVGLDRVRAAAVVTRPRGLPLVAIGGITLDRAAGVLRAGASSVAVISDLLSTGEPEARVRAYVLQLGGV